VRAQVDREIPGVDDGRALPHAAAQHRPHARHHFPRAEGLRDVVVRAELEPEQLVRLFVARREHDDRRRPLGANPPAHLPPVHARQHEIEHHQIGPQPRHRGEGGLAVSRLLNREPVPLQIRPQQFYDLRFVVDDQNGSHRVSRA
jgi:hypothetical protein